MKPNMLFAIIIITAIVIIAGFGLQLGDMTHVQIPHGTEGTTLFICPAADNSWDMISFSMHVMNMNRYVMMALFGAALLLGAVWSWQLYILLLKDKFERSAFSAVWKYTKLWFWACVIALILIVTPNHFRRVSVTGRDGEWVLCESNTPGAQAERANQIHIY